MGEIRSGKLPENARCVSNLESRPTNRAGRVPAGHFRQIARTQEREKRRRGKEQMKRMSLNYAEIQVKFFHFFLIDSLLKIDRQREGERFVGALARGDLPTSDKLGEHLLQFLSGTHRA